MSPSPTVVTLVWFLYIVEWSSCRCGGSLTFIRTCRFLIPILAHVLSICNIGNSCISLLCFCSGKGRGFDHCCKLVYLLLQVLNSSLFRSSHCRFYLQGGRLHFSEFFPFCIQHLIQEFIISHLSLLVAESDGVSEILVHTMKQPLF